MMIREAKLKDIEQIYVMRNAGKENIHSSFT